MISRHRFSAILKTGWIPKDFLPQTPEQQAFRESVLRGNEIYMTRTFWISDSTHINSIGLGNPLKRTCATCHNMQNTGMDLAPGYVDLCTTNLPTANNMTDLPLFKVTCKDSATPHPYLGREVYTYDPGRALISGECRDIGAITMQQMRGLAGRAPYFSNGSAQTLGEIIDFYDRRYNIGHTEQERQDLVNFLSVL
jgi:cytochrome c peroxidase